MLLCVIFVALCSWSVEASTVLPGLRGEPTDKSSFRVDYQFYPRADGWLKLHRIPVTWYEARVACYLEGAHLASPINDDLAMVMSTLAQAARLETIHTGIRSEASVEDYYSREGIPLSRIPVTWAEDEPNNLDNKERCLAMTAQGAMADTDCQYGSIRPFFCYKKKQGFSTMNKCGYHDSLYQVDPNTNHCYKYHQTPRNWQKALSVCSAEGGTLAVINSEAEAQFIAKLPLNHNYKSFVFIGFLNWYNQKGHWVTLDGTTLKEAGFERWLKGEPNNLGGQEYCGSFVTLNNGVLEFNDSACHSQYPFVCEIAPTEHHQ